VRFLRASFEGVRAPTKRGTFRGRVSYRVTIKMAGLKRGIYTARVVYRVSRKGRKEHRATQVQAFRPCYGNPKGGGPEGPNRLTITIL
jgi:hypothetical protein